MPASGLKQAGSMKVITNLSKCGLMTDSGLSRSVCCASVISCHRSNCLFSRKEAERDKSRPYAVRVHFLALDGLFVFRERGSSLMNHSLLHCYEQLFPYQQTQPIAVYSIIAIFREIICLFGGFIVPLHRRKFKSDS